MTRIDFYLLPVAVSHGKLSFACRLAEKAFRQGLRVHVHASDDSEADAIDELLWSFRDTSFVPHRRIDADTGAAVPVLIGWGGQASEHHDMLINLAQEVPPLFGRFERVAEIVLDDDRLRAASRERWRHYKERGYPLAHHDLQHLHGGQASDG